MQTSIGGSFSIDVLSSQTSYNQMTTEKNKNYWNHQFVPLKILICELESGNFDYMLYFKT